MIRIFINGLAASAGGGLTYLRNVIPELAQRADVKTTVALDASFQPEFGDLPNISFVGIRESSHAFQRFFREQANLPALIRRSAAQVLISAGNFALWNSPIPQVLLSRNSLYTSNDFSCDVRARGDYILWADTLVKGWLARQSIRRAEVTVAPSGAFAADLSHWSEHRVLSLHHGFNQELFAADASPLPLSAKMELENANDDLRLLFVSHYNYYRNFETLIRAMPILSSRLNRKVNLFLTCHLRSEVNPGKYRADSVASLARAVGATENIVELGTIPYRSLHHLYRSCQVYVTPAYAESFAHPLIEAMSSGLPIVASDLPVHREICGDAAVYFSRFSPEELAQQVLRVQESPELAGNLSRSGLGRARDFSWTKHVDGLLDLAQELLTSRRERN